MCQIRNPWGEGEWKGKWSDNSSEWTPGISNPIFEIPALMKELSYVNADDGTFWMEFQDFCEQYNRLYFLEILSKKWQRSVIRGCRICCVLTRKGDWKGVTAGGCANFSTWKDNRQYGFELEAVSDVFI